MTFRPVVSVLLAALVLAPGARGHGDLRVHRPHANAPTELELLRAQAASDPEHRPTLAGDTVHFPRGPRVEADGAHVEVGSTGIGIGLVALGRAGAWTELGSGGQPMLAGPEVRVGRAPGVVEWWRSLASGLEHGVTIAASPRGSGPLALEVAVSGAHPTLAAAGRVRLEDPSGIGLARYEGLFVLDALGTSIPARLAVAGDRIRIEIDDHEALYPLVVDPIFTTEEALLVGADTTDDDQLGGSVAMSDDGSRVLVGALTDDTPGGTNAGSARIFERDLAGAWTEVATLRATSAAPNDIFGGAVALSGDGNRALVGAFGDDIGPLSNAGSARVFTRSVAGVWSEEAILLAPDGASDDWLGRAVALSVDGTRALVGASEREDGVASDTGGAYVFSRSTGGVWSLEATLLSSFADNYDRFATSVALSRDGTRALIGAPDDDTPRGVRCGSATVFTRSGAGVWSEEARLTDPGGAGDDTFGIAVALSSDGTTALVGANGDETVNGFAVGSAHVFSRNGTAAWTHDAALLAALGAVYDILGWSVALSGDGSIALVAMPGDDFGSLRVDVGSALLFTRTSPGVWVEDSTVVSADGVAGDGFGSSVALSANGRRAVIGVSRDTTPRGASTGSARAFSLAPPLANGAACGVAGACASGFCVDGVCCNAACVGGAADCQACTSALTGAASGTCAPAAVATVCRASTALCDAPESCDGTARTCPPDVLDSTGTVCRAPVSACDVAETCSGASPSCPGDVVAPSGTTCRPSTPGGCDRAEVCDGIGAACPGDGFAAAGVVCRVATLGCDVAESCDGSRPACPADAFAAAGNVCRSSAGPCDVTEACTGDVATCPTDVFAPPSVLCDATTTGVCDAPNYCSGSGPACPELYLTGVECRPGAGACDLAELCSGSSGACPPDGLLASGVVCRASTDASCDPDETCDGTGSACALDVNRCVASADSGPRADADVADAGPAAQATTGCACRVESAERRSDAAQVTLLGVLAALAVRRGSRRAAARRRRHAAAAGVAMTGRRFALATAIALAACTSVDGTSDGGLDASFDAGPRPDSPRVPRHDAECASDAGPIDPSGLLAPGPFAAGVRTVSLTDDTRARALPIDIWFPAEAGTGLTNAYFLDLGGSTIASLCSPARRDATPLTPTSPRGLVIFSHGFGGVRFQSYFLAEHLATHGWIVAAMDHPNNTFADLDMLNDDAAAAQSAIDRPLDVIFVLDHMLLDGAGTGLTVDPARVAVSGHSFGAWTSIEVARRDPRFAVVISLAPGFPAPSSPSIAGELGVRPLFILGGSVDETTPFAEQDAAYMAASAPKLLVRVEGAGHLDFSDLCRVSFLAGVFNDGCDAASIEPERVRGLTARLTERFLRRYLDGDTTVDADLDVAAIEALGDTTAWRTP